MSRLQKALFLSDKGYTDLKKAIFACTLTNLAMLLPFCVTVMIFSEILTPFVSGWLHPVEPYLDAVGARYYFGHPGISGRQKRLPQNLYCLV